ncbi:MAG: substrate-binding domain-containing protein, partial [Novosphingobium sp.]
SPLGGGRRAQPESARDLAICAALDKVAGEAGVSRSGAGFSWLMAHPAGIAFDPVLVCDGEFDFDSGVRGAGRLLDLPEPPTAIFASNDDMAAGVLAVAHDRNIDLPGELSVAGFDDTTLARTVWPPLTTIHQPMAELAQTAAEILIEGGDITHRRLPHQLIERASVAPPYRKIS